jgi:hypothetical protein
MVAGMPLNLRRKSGRNRTPEFSGHSKGGSVDQVRVESVEFSKENRIGDNICNPCRVILSS